MAELNVLDYGAIGDGTINDRAAIQKAIDLCGAAGGGGVVIPSGKFLSGTIVLKSDVELHLEQGALLIGSLDEKAIIDDTKRRRGEAVDEGWEGGCFLYALHEKNVSITGKGTICGQGDRVFFDDDADGGFHECPKNYPGFRPRTTFFEDIENLTVEGIAFREAAFWTLHLAGCRRVLVDGVRILNDPRGANNDGIDPDTCKDVVIMNCIIDTGDDAIVIKNSQAMAAKYGACENIIISACVLHSHDSAIKIGTETFDAIRNVIVGDRVFKDCSRGIGI
jgi:polygalacturonase